MRLLRPGGLVFLCLFAICLSGRSAAQTSSDGLVAEWHMDEDFGNFIFDSSGNGYTGTIDGALWTEGVSGSALVFDGWHSHVDIANIPTSEFTLGAWVKLIGAPADPGGIIIEKWRTGQGRAWILSVLGPDEGTVPLEPRVDWGTSSMGGVKTDAGFSLEQNKWYYLSATVTNNGNTSTGRIYVDGVLRNSNTWDGIPNETSTSVTIGAGDFNDATSPRHYFPGVIDEVSVYTRPLDINALQVEMGTPVTLSNAQQIQDSAEEIRTFFNNNPNRFDDLTTLVPRSSGPFNPNSPTVVITHGFNTKMDYYSPDNPNKHWSVKMQEALETQSPNANIYFFDWSAFDADLERRWEEHVGVSFVPKLAQEFYFSSALGEELFKQLKKIYEDQGLVPDWDNIQLMGHSMGTWVNTFAAYNINAENDKLGQLTYFDIPIFYPGTGDTIVSSSDFVENYIALTGTIGSFLYGGAYAAIDKIASPVAGAITRQVINITPTNPLPNPGYDSFLTNTLVYGHDGASAWYLETISDQTIEDGYYYSLAGSKTRPAPDVMYGLDASQTLERVIYLTEKTADVLGDVANGIWEHFKKMNNVTITSMTVAKFTESSPAYLFKDIAIPDDVNYFSFDYYFSDPGDGDFLTVSFNDTLLFMMEGDGLLGHDGFISSGLIEISDLSGQTGEWLFALNSMGEANAELFVKDLKFYNVAVTPEPVSSLLFLLGGGALAGVRRLRRRKS